MSSETMHQIVELIESEARSCLSAIEFEIAYQFAGYEGRRTMVRVSYRDLHVMV